MLKKISVALVLIFFFHSQALAKIMFTPSITYMDQKQDDGTNPETDAKLTIIDLRLGYVFDMGLYVGGLYSIQDHDLLSDTSDSYMGPSVGYYHSGFFIVGTYYFYGEKDITDGSGKLGQVSGYQLDVSYTVPLTDTIRLGPQLTYHNYKFDELEVNGFAQPADFSFSSITPYFNLMFLF